MGAGGSSTDAPDPHVIAGIAIPATVLARKTRAVVEAAAPPALVNHSLRAFVLAGLKASHVGVPLDSELVFIACLLHDLGLTQAHMGDPTQVFEKNSVAFAGPFLRQNGYDETRIATVSRGILLHAGDAGGEPPDIVAIMHGAAQDLFGPDPQAVSDAALLAIERAVPRLAFKSAFPAILNAHIDRVEPSGWGWTKDFVEAPPPTFFDNRWSE